MDLTVVTYGSGEVLKNVFNSVAMLMNGQDGDLLRPLMIVSASIGAVWVAVKAMFSGSAEALVSRYFLPLLAVTGILMVPTTTVTIEDILQQRSYRVSHVPVLLARVSELFNSVGYHLTQSVEKVMHTPNDADYTSTGMIFGSETAMDMRNYKITNGDLAANLQKFSKQCVLYDLALNRYGIDELRKSTNLWEFFKENTSRSRMIDYCEPKAEGVQAKCNLKSCQEALELMKDLFEKEKAYYSKQHIFSGIGVTFQALTNLQIDSKELIGQQLMMNFLSNEYRGKNFAKARAKEQQRNTYYVLGSLASGSLITMRGVLEALIYASFIFILPLTLLPGGHTYLLSWLGLVAWIQTWPPFYAILNYIMQTVAQAKVQNIFLGVPVEQQGLSLFTSSGLSILHEDIFALAGYLSASIPFISYAILKGGVGSFIHLSGAMMTPAHQSAASAASELTTGNYSYGNMSYGGISYGNESMLQRNYSTSLSCGFMKEDTGNISTTYTPSEFISQQRESSFRGNVISQEAIGNTLTGQRTQLISLTENMSKSYSEDMSNGQSSISNLSSYMNNSGSFKSEFSLGESGQFSRSISEIESSTKQFAKENNLQENEAFNVLATASLSSNKSVLGRVVSGVSGLEGSVGGNYNSSASQQELMKNAESFVNSHNLQEHYNRVESFGKSEAFSSLSDEGKRMSSDISNSFGEIHRSSESLGSTLQDLEQVSEQESAFKSDSASYTISKNQAYSDWLKNEKGIDHIQWQKPNFNHKPYVQEFLFNTSNSHEGFSGGKDAIVDRYEHSNFAQDFRGEYEEDSANIEEKASHRGLKSGIVESKGFELDGQVSMRDRTISREINDSRSSISEHKNQLDDNFRDKSDSSLFLSAIKKPAERGIDTVSAITNKAGGLFGGKK